jgi:uncharacterized protein (DUF2141 family)
MKIRLLLTAASALILALFPIPSRCATSHGELRVVVMGLRDNNGRVGCSLFDGPDGFPRTKAKEFRGMWTKKHANVAVCNFTDIPAGTYAVTVLDDSNSDGKMDFNLLGLPKKGYGFSNDAKATLTPPSFNEASFSYNGEGTLKVSIHIVYRIP